MKNPFPSDDAVGSREGPGRGFLRRLAALVFVVVAACQFWLVARIGHDLPLWDQWGAEGHRVYGPLVDGSWQFKDFFAPHSEHRIVSTRFVQVALFQANGGWDPLLQLLVNVVLRSALAASVVLLLCRSVSRSEAGIIAGAAVVLYLPCLAWENVLWGFQLQVSFVILFAVLAFVAFSHTEPSRVSVALGVALGLGSMVSMGAGLLVPGAVLVLLLFSWRQRALERGGAALAVAAAGLVAVAALLHRTEPGHAALRASAVAEFFTAALDLLAWPHVGMAVAAVVMSLPLGLWVVLQASRRLPWSPAGAAVLLLGSWSAAVVLSLAWVRGGQNSFGVVMPSRYVDFLALLILTNVAALVLLLRHATPSRQRTARLLALAWGGFTLVGLAGVASETMKYVIGPRLADPTAPVRRAVAFQQTDNPDVFTGVPRIARMSADLTDVRSVLRDPRLQGKLPPSFQPDRPLGPLSGFARQLIAWKSVVLGALAVIAVWLAVGLRKAAWRAGGQDGASLGVR